MNTNANTITTMGIISDRVYNQDKGKDYFKIGANVEANGTTYKVIDHTPTDNQGFNALFLVPNVHVGNAYKN